MGKKIITTEHERYGVWQIIEANIVNPDTQSAQYVGRPVFSKCVCTNCNDTQRYIRNNELKKYSDKLCAKCTAAQRLALIRPKIGEVFGKLTIIADGGVKDQARHYSICKCECGNVVEVMDNRLRSGNTTSCGQCKYSKGEYIISQILNENNIIYDHDILLPELFQQTQRRLRFDFIVYNNDGTINRFIEFDGNQHKTGMWGGEWSNTETYDTIHERDLIKNKFCLDNNYTLIRIPYTKLATLTLNDLMEDKYKVYE